MYAVFNIEPVMCVEVASKLKREDRRQRESKPQERKKGSLFAQTLETAVETEAPAQYTTVVYGRNGKMAATNYRTRNY